MYIKNNKYPDENIRLNHESFRQFCCKNAVKFNDNISTQ